MTARTSVCVFSAAHGRPDVSRLVLEQRRLLVDGLADAGVAATALVYADDENLEIARGFGFEAVEHRNEPLGAKCSAGLRHAARLADHVVWVGSDDWIHPDLARELLVSDDDFALIHAGRRLALVDLPRGRLTRILSHSVWGSIPWVIDSRLLRDERHHPISPELDRGLDGALVRGIRRSRIPFRFETHDPHPFRCVDFKTSANLHQYAPLAQGRATSPEEDAWTALADWFDADLVEGARALSTRLSQDKE